MKKSVGFSIFVTGFVLSQPRMIIDFQQNNNGFPLAKDVKPVSFLIDALDN